MRASYWFCENENNITELVYKSGIYVGTMNDISASAMATIATNSQCVISPQEFNKWGAKYGVVSNEKFRVSCTKETRKDIIMSIIKTWADIANSGEYLTLSYQGKGGGNPLYFPVSEIRLNLLLSEINL